jgi:hypothetical protein
MASTKTDQANSVIRKAARNTLLGAGLLLLVLSCLPLMEYLDKGRITRPHVPVVVGSRFSASIWRGARTAV